MLEKLSQLGQSAALGAQDTINDYASLGTLAGLGRPTPQLDVNQMLNIRDAMQKQQAPASPNVPGANAARMLGGMAVPLPIPMPVASTATAIAKPALKLGEKGLEKLAEESKLWSKVLSKEGKFGVDQHLDDSAHLQGRILFKMIKDKDEVSDVKSFLQSYARTRAEGNLSTFGDVKQVSDDFRPFLQTLVEKNKAGIVPDDVLNRAKKFHNSLDDTLKGTAAGLGDEFLDDFSKAQSATHRINKLITGGQ